MRILKILGWISHFLLITLFLFGIILLLVIKSSFLHENFEEWIVTYNGREIQDNKALFIKSFLIIGYILYLVYFVAVFLLNLCIRQFEKRNFLTHKNAIRMHIVGILFILNYCITFALQKLIVINTSFNNSSVLETESSYIIFSERIFHELQTPLSGLFIGLFFIAIGQVFKEAILYKEENELTV